MKTVTVSEAALDSLKAMGRRDKERIEQLEGVLQQVCDIFNSNGHPITAESIREVLVNPYSNAVIQKAE